MKEPYVDGLTILFLRFWFRSFEDRNWFITTITITRIVAGVFPSYLTSSVHKGSVDFDL